jgi:hypothetical protein
MSVEKHFVSSRDFRSRCVELNKKTGQTAPHGCPGFRSVRLYYMLGALFSGFDIPDAYSCSLPKSGQTHLAIFPGTGILQNRFLASPDPRPIAPLARC